MIPNILSIAGSDPSGGAGIQGDLKVFAALECYGMAVITALTAQNAHGVRGRIDVPARFVGDQIAAVFEDIDVSAVKIGMVSNVEIIEVIIDAIEKYKPANIIFDPVMVASSGDELLSKDALCVMKQGLIPLCSVITPNIIEGEKLLRKAVIDMDIAAADLLKLGSGAVLLKGGHMKGDIARDVLAQVGSDGVEVFEAPRIYTQNNHGTGCALSSAIACYLGLGFDLVEACSRAKEYLSATLLHADLLDVGAVNHGFKGDRGG